MIAKNIGNASSSTIALGTTPIVLAYFAEKNKGTREDLTKTVYRVSRLLDDTRLRIDAVFKGSISSSSKRDFSSETVDEEIWYWLSNKFLKTCEDNDDDLCLEVNISKKKLLDKYKISNIKSTLDTKYDYPEADISRFVSVLDEVIVSDGDDGQ